MAIHIVETCFVKPVTPTKRHTLALSGLDLYWSAYGYACTLNFYKIHGQDKFASIIRSLKRSLSILLVDFYPVAGRLVEDPAGHLTLDCNDAGVEFIEAFADTSFGHLESMDFAIQDFFPALARTGSRVGKEDPVLSVQVTSFPGSGVVIGVTTDHVLFDGYCFTAFMNGWAECCNGVPLSSPPCHMRRVFSDSMPIPNHPPISNISTATHHFDSLQGAPAPPAKEALEPRMMAVTADMVQKLKMEVNAGANMQAPFTTFECLAAYLWKARTKADRQLSEDDEVGLRFRLGLRQRLDPKLPANYFGPTIIHAEVGDTKAGELRSESLGATAGRVREAICAYSKQDKIKQELERYESGKVLYGGQKKMVVTEIIDGRRVDFYGAQFDWGELRALRPATARYAGVFSLDPPRGGASGLELVLRLSNTEMEVLVPSLFQ